jgi:hypothetical protein
VRRALAQRQLALGGLAILGVAGSIAVTSRTHRAANVRLPPAQGAYTALAGSSGPPEVGTTTACDVLIGAGTEGVENPVLPCGTRLYVGYRSTNVLVTVIDRGPKAAGQEFGLTDALARRLGVTGTKRIRWSYVGSG